MTIFARLQAFIMAFILTQLCLPTTQLPSFDAAEDAVSHNLTVMSYNVYTTGVGEHSPKNRAPRVAAIIRSVMPDSFGVQEANYEWLMMLSEELPQYSFVGIGRNQNGKGESSAVFYLTEKYDLVESDTFWLSATPEKESKGWGALFKRISTYAVLRDKATNFQYVHFNTHLDNMSEWARINSVAVISQKASQFNLPLVLTGDMNTKESSRSYDRFLEIGLTDLRKAADRADEGITYHGYMKQKDINKGLPIDYIFANSYLLHVESFSIITEKIDGIYPSDHFPISASFSFAGD